MLANVRSIQGEEMRDGDGYSMTSTKEEIGWSHEWCRVLELCEKNEPS